MIRRLLKRFSRNYKIRFSELVKQNFSLFSNDITSLLHGEFTLRMRTFQIVISICMSVFGTSLVQIIDKIQVLVGHDQDYFRIVQTSSKISTERFWTWYYSNDFWSGLYKIACHCYLTIFFDRNIYSHIIMYAFVRI